MDIIFEAMTDTGLKRKNNEDRIFSFTDENHSVFVVADGMGGHDDGEYASGKIVSLMDELCRSGQLPYDINELTDKVLSVIRNTNTEILSHSAANNITCGSTVSVLLISGKKYAVINIGDSPIYCIDRSGFTELSTAHSYDVIKLRSTLLDSTELDKNRSGRLIQAVGVKKKLYPNIITGIIKKKITFFLCSDGISKYYAEKQMKRSLAQVHKEKIAPKHFMENTKEYVYSRGASDNFSGLCVLIKER